MKRKYTGSTHWRRTVPKQKTDAKQAALFLLQDKRKSYFLPLQEHFPCAHVTGRKSSARVYVDCIGESPEVDMLKLGQPS